METSRMNRVLVVAAFCLSSLLPSVLSSLPPTSTTTTTYAQHIPPPPPPGALDSSATPHHYHPPTSHHQVDQANYHPHIPTHNTHVIPRLVDDKNDAQITNNNPLEFELQQPISFDLANSSSELKQMENTHHSDLADTSLSIRALSALEHGRHVREAREPGSGKKRRRHKKRYKKRRPNRRNGRTRQKTNRDGTRSGHSHPRPPNHRK
ncbi:hypothetical protein Pcinc_015280 [Petrolisthes cinctipes]|uniref:Uncharacterized protein n=1 Tax=Petrolisthes cinctipes TaxID=88211 RepID=A0AAE1FUU2_PETCI|nr:hypothetical protein Pcinc_015280 [Petrolisthes cinctipes]